MQTRRRLDPPRAAGPSSPGAFGCLGLLIPGRRVRPPGLDAMVRPVNPRLRVAILAGQYDQANLPAAKTCGTHSSKRGTPSTTSSSP